MKNYIMIIFMFVLSFCFSGCSSAGPDVQATVDAAVLETQQAGLSQQDEAVATAVAATDIAQEAMQTTIQAAVSATVAAMPTPTPVNVDELSEEEMVVAVESSAQEATDSTEQAVQYAEDAASDGELTTDEIQTIELYFSIADEEIQQALELVYLYASVYEELAEETIDLLYAVEEDLSSLSQSAGEIYDTLVYIDQSIEAGQELAQETITQLQTQTENIQNQIEEVKNQSGDWVTAIKDEIQSRPDRYLNIEPDELFTDRKDVLTQVKDYVEVVQASLLDGIINRSEMDSIALQGANAVAGLDALGGQDRLDMERFSDSINGVTAQLARGDLPQARSGIDNLQRSLPRR